VTQHLSSQLPISPPHRYLALCLPWLPAQRAQRVGIAPPDAPFALVEHQRGTLRIAALDPRAARLGLELGLGLSEARARVPELAALPFAPAADAALMVKLARVCGAYTPSVAVDPPPVSFHGPALHGLVLDITGCAHLHGGEQALVAALVQRFGKLGITARAALGATPDAARALARFGVAEVHALPLAALGIDGEALMALRRAGFRRIGDLAELPRAPLAARFGSELMRRLGHLLGEQDPHIVPLRAPEPILLCQRFAEPIARTDDVLDTIEMLLVRAAGQLADRAAGGRAFAVRLHRSDGHVARLVVETSAPTRDPALVMRLLRERIDSLADPLDPGFGYDAIDLAVPRSEPLAETQQLLKPLPPAGGVGGGQELGAARGKCPPVSRATCLSPPLPAGGRGEETPDLGPLLDRLAVRYGADSVLRFAGADSHIPERAGTLRPVQANMPASPAPLPNTPPREDGEPPRRPLLLFDPPQRIEVIASVPDGPPRRFAWRGRSYVAVRHEGPERIAPEWWRRQGGHDDNPGLTRDYYRVEDEGGHRFWLFRHGLYSEAATPPHWYIHGLFA
jgi:protein ImuB